ncbi:diphosphomevalonate decarboxylase [Lignoscripta atroalba]|nr:diphosphomevalonate decarboxylase [Lignoscripta atroalba]
MAEQKVYRASTTAPVNIAVIKYWGKRDPSLNLPTNSSLSVTLSQSDLRTHTTASCSASFPPSDTLLLNSAPQEISSARPKACIHSLRALRAALEDVDPSLPPLSTFPLRLVSVNNFPTAAGLASSAAGFAALVRAIADLYALPQSPTELSLIARQGSGSACRSLLGGYVAWDKGSRDDGIDSVARVVAPLSHWPEMRALILVVSADKKGVSSTTGMQTTVNTSKLFPMRANEVVPQEMKAMEKAILEKDFQSFGRVTMRESNSFHATCLDTEPPIFYLNDVSRAAIRAVEDINERAGKIIAAYTFDAGPNAVIYYLQQYTTEVAGLFKATLGGKSGWDGEGGKAVGAAEGASILDEKVANVLRDGVSRVILTGIGEGPISVDDHLIDEQGEPVKA